MSLGYFGLSGDAPGGGLNSNSAWKNEMVLRAAALRAAWDRASFDSAKSSLGQRLPQATTWYNAHQRESGGTELRDAIRSARVIYQNQPRPGVTGAASAGAGRRAVPGSPAAGDAGVAVSGGAPSAGTAKEGAGEPPARGGSPRTPRAPRANQPRRGSGGGGARGVVEDLRNLLPGGAEGDEAPDVEGTAQGIIQGARDTIERGVQGEVRRRASSLVVPVLLVGAGLLVAGTVVYFVLKGTSTPPTPARAAATAKTQVTP